MSLEMLKATHSLALYPSPFWVPVATLTHVFHQLPTSLSSFLLETLMESFLHLNNGFYSGRVTGSNSFSIEPCTLFL